MNTNAEEYVALALLLSLTLYTTNPEWVTGYWPPCTNISELHNVRFSDRVDQLPGWPSCNDR